MKDESPAVKDWAPRYSPDQRRALITAVVDEQVKVPDAIRLAGQGELGGLQPFTMPTSTAYGIVDKERKRRHANRSQQEMIDDLWDQMLHRVARELKRLTDKPKLTGPEITELRGWLKLSREVDRRPKPTSNEQRQPDDRPQGTRERSFIDDLAEQATARAAEAQEEPAQTPTSPTGEDPVVWRTEEPSTPDTSPTVTDAQRKAAQALLTAGNGLGSLTS